MSKSARVQALEEKQLHNKFAELVSEIPEPDDSDSKRQRRLNAALKLPIEDLKAILQTAQEQDSQEDIQVEQARNRLLKSSKDSRIASSSSQSMSTGATSGDKASSSSSSSSGTSILPTIPETDQSIKLAQDKEEERIRFQLLGKLTKISPYEFDQCKKPDTPFNYLKYLYHQEYKTDFVATPPTPPPVQEPEVVVQEEGPVIQTESSSSSSAKSDKSEPVKTAEQKRPTPLDTTTGTSKGTSSSSSQDPQPALKKLKTGEQLGKGNEETSLTRPKSKQRTSAGDSEEDDDDDYEDDESGDESDQDVKVLTNTKTKSRSSSSSFGVGLAAGDDSVKSAKSGKSANKKAGGTPNSKKRPRGLDTTTNILTHNRHLVLADRLDELAKVHRLTSASKMNNVANDDRGICEICYTTKGRGNRQSYLCRGCTRIHSGYICWICQDHAMQHAFEEAKQAHFHLTAMELQEEEEEE